MAAPTKGIFSLTRSLLCVAVLSQGAIALGGFVPLPKSQTLNPGDSSKLDSLVSSAPLPTLPQQSHFVFPTDTAVVIPVVDVAPSHTQASTPTAVPLPPALETGLSGGATIILFAGFRKLRRIIRTGL